VLQAPASVRLDRNTRHRLETRARLVSAGRRLFGARGFEGVAVAHIAEEADVAVGSFYNYFRSKEDLLDTVSAASSAALTDVLDALTATLDDPAERIAAAVGHMVRLAERDPEWTWFVVRTSESFPSLVEDVTAPIARHVLAGIAGGHFVAEDRTVAVTAVGGVLLRVMRAMLLGTVGPHADRIVAEQVLRLLGLEPGAARAIVVRSLSRRSEGLACAARPPARRSSTRKERLPCPKT
jgi:AcrR family transcriptional regulator